VYIFSAAKCLLVFTYLAKSLSSLSQSEVKESVLCAKRDINILRTSIYRHSQTQKHIMFAATQQIASVAGLKATKVQVRTLSSSHCRSREKISRFQSARARLSEFTFCVSNFKRYENHARKKEAARRRWKPLARARERDASRFVVAQRMKNTARASSFFLRTRAIIRSRRYSLID